jgi:2-polyprenyl-3-methyl-5-hydroxy-6-metoxy-1,4-benzoquinol methylase
MADFRRPVYARYVSAFKTDIVSRQGPALAQYFRWCEIKYRPFVEALPDGCRVLDLGCGSGDLMRFLVSRGVVAEGIDISEEQVNVALNAGLEVSQADAFDFLATRREMYDGIVAVDFLEHFHKDELLRLLDAIGRALKPNGLLLIQTPNGEGLFASQIIYGDLTHMTILSPRSLRQALALAGFGNISVYEAGPAPIGVRGRVRSVIWRAVSIGVRLLRYTEAGRAAPVLTENMIGVAQRAAPARD